MDRNSPPRGLSISADHGVAIHYIQPGKPDQNTYLERFNRCYRTEVLNAHLFESVAELRALTGTWLRIYNRERPPDSPGRVPPLTFLPRPSLAGQFLLRCLLDWGAYAPKPAQPTYIYVLVSGKAFSDRLANCRMRLHVATQFDRLDRRCLRNVTFGPITEVTNRAL